MTWWRDLGRSHGYQGTFSVHRLKCPFCSSRGAFKKVFNAYRTLELGLLIHSEVFECNECGNYTFVMWGGEASRNLHDFVQFPTLTDPEAPDYWPEQIGSSYVQAEKSLNSESWDAAAAMARRAIQATIRSMLGKSQGQLRDEITKLVEMQMLPKTMGEWAGEVRELGNVGAHPDEIEKHVAPEDAKAIVRFTRYFILYAVDIPHEIDEYRKPAQP